MMIFRETRQSIVGFNVSRCLLRNIWFYRLFTAKSIVLLMIHRKIYSFPLTRDSSKTLQFYRRYLVKSIVYWFLLRNPGFTGMISHETNGFTMPAKSVLPVIFREIYMFTNDSRWYLYSFNLHHLRNMKFYQWIFAFDGFTNDPPWNIYSVTGDLSRIW